MGVALDQRDTARGCFLLAPGVVREDVFQGDAGQVDPAGVGRQLETQDILLLWLGLHAAKLCRFAGNSRPLNEDFLERKLKERSDNHALRRLKLQDPLLRDFCSNDYLGIATNGLIEKAMEDTREYTVNGPHFLADATHGSGGSRLLAGNYFMIEAAETVLAHFHAAEAGLIFNSGYDANLGVLSSIPQRGDTILYDALSHASIRDGVRLSFARSFSFAHNDMADLEKRLTTAEGNIFVVTESVFSMDGDQAPLVEIVKLCQQYGAYLIVDEAHATGVVGPHGEGLVQALHLETSCLARIHTFGKAVGCHGAIVLGSRRLRDYLINFARPFIYTTALPPSAIAAIRMAYTLFPSMDAEREHLYMLIWTFQQADLGYKKLTSSTPIQGVIVPGNDEVRALAEKLEYNGFDIRPILYPTVPKGEERLRIVLHAFNTPKELDRLIDQLQ